MFAHPEQHNAALHNGLKRGREDETVDSIGPGAILGFTEHRNKRLQTLPLRSAPTSNKWPPNASMSPESLPLHRPNALTPSDSDSEEAVPAHFGHYSGPPPHQPQHSEYSSEPRSHFSPWSSSPGDVVVQEPVASGPADFDRDMDMMMDSVEEATLEEQPGGLEPGPFHPDSAGTSLAGRMPTPIQPSFAAQVRGNNWGGAAAHVMQTRPHQQHHQGDVDGVTIGAGFGSSPAAGLLMTNVSPIDVPDRTVPRSLEHANTMAEWSLVQNRPLPSPISESGGEELGSPGMVLDSTTMIPSLPPRASSAMELPIYLRGSSPSSSFCDDAGIAGSMDMECSQPVSPPNHQRQAQELEQLRQQQPSPATPSPKKGHTRSRHTLNNWTLQPGMKKSFSIGYRADCEKCRLKVPGHFNHIIIS